MDRSSGTELSNEQVSRLNFIAVALPNEQGDVALLRLLNHWNQKDGGSQTPASVPSATPNC